MILFLDTETFSPVALKTAGLARYATEVEVTIVTWAVDDGPVQVWDRSRDVNMPPSLNAAARDCDRAIAHNSQFDETVCRADLPELAALLDGKWYCTMAQAYRHGLPGGLDKLSTVLQLHSDHAKDKRGLELIKLFCMPQKDGSRATRSTHPREWHEFLEYAKQDIVALREIHRKLPKWNDSPEELALWRLDQKINQRGIGVDVEFARAALRATTAEQKRLTERTRTLTASVVDRTTQRDRMLAFLFAEFGVDLPDLKADTIERRLEDPELPEYAKELLRIRQQASKSSTSKYKRLLEMEVAGRLYFLLQYCAAYRTGRWGGRNFQPQNLPRPSLKYDEILVAIAAVIETAEEYVLEDIMEAMSSALRSALIAGPGRKLVVSDLANIEGRGLAWLACEEWKLQAFRDFDAGIGPDLYKVAYGRSFGIDPETVADDSLERQVGKVLELAMGYQGGVAAFVAMAAVYGLDLAELAEQARPTIPRGVLLDAEGTYQWAVKKRLTHGLPQEVFVVLESLKRLWRGAHPATESLWGELETAARCAILNKNTVFEAGRLKFDRKGAWLRMHLPSGRFLLYPNPRLEGPLQTIEFAGWDVYKRRWARVSTYGGKLAENATQALARDVMGHGMLRAEEAGYPIVLTVHDELVTEPVDAPEFTAKGLSGLLASVPPWAQGLPLAAKGFESQRYRK